MRLDIPFYISDKDGQCGPLSLRMVADYFKIKHDSSKINELVNQLSNGMVWTAGIALAGKKLGLNSKFVTSSYGEFLPQIDFYEKYADNEAMRTLQVIKHSILEQKVAVEERNMSLEELLSNVSERSVPIVLINYYALVQKEGFFGHIVPITGHDESAVYIHQMGPKNVTPHLKIEKNIFLKAWESNGTDKDCVILSV